MFARFKKFFLLESIKVIVSKDAKNIFDKYRQTKESSTEACGILIGQHSVNDDEVKIETVTIPSKLDKREKYYFEIDSQHHQEILDSEFYDSKKKSVYLGTWHSHPEQIPTPSRCDIKDWKKQYRKNKYLFDNMIFVIVGQNIIKYWLINKNKLSEIKVDYISYE